MTRSSPWLLALWLVACEDENECAYEEFPSWGFVPFGGDTERVPFDPDCPRCDETLTEFMADLTCAPEEDDVQIDEDAGFLEQAKWKRSEGCGSVQFSDFTRHPVFINFDADTGKVIGWAFLDDIGDPPCNAVGTVSGEIRHACDDEVVTYCVHE